MSIWVVINPHAAAFGRAPGLIDAVRRRAEPGSELCVTETISELGKFAKEIADREVERVVLCGGDGTYMAGVSALSRALNGRALPELVLAPGGTVATVARSFGQGANLLETVERATRTRSSEGEVTSSPTLAVREDSGEARVGFIFGTGLVARFFERYYAGQGLGYAAAARIVARVFVGSFVADEYSRSVLDPLPCTLSVDGERLPAPGFSLVLCSVVRDVGLHLLVCHRAGADAERPHLVASSLPPRRLGPQLHRVFLGRGLRDPGGFDQLTTRFRLEFADRGPYVLDGDLLHAHAVEVSAGPVIRVRSFR